MMANTRFIHACRRWNSASGCPDGASCKFEHICTFCGKKHTFHNNH